MSYEDLPPDLRTIPLTDNTVQADVVDLILGIDERRSGALALMLCDEGDRGVQPIVLSDLPPEAPAVEVRSLLDLLLPMVGEANGAILLGRGRRRGLMPTDNDRAWHQATIEACSRHKVRLLGFYLASPDGVEALPDPLSQAS
ncbi:hypothetical protein [Pedococcus bigeumensis]|jgi:hypothetical protein|uniref:Uncharacterized protein n=1 Tax=Pedococcus bigeumensis TaxID=433644 RepID=A0A502CH77_9MICO|nr:hypothetical protein [Pedococcus bigeumensis]TPG12527.1 hypothetical protein EAH86_19660 [Pedococcus bigeumensis]